MGYRPLAVSVCVLFIGACASVFGSHQKQFDFQSNPPGANVMVNGSPVGTTPVKIELSNHKEYVITFQRAGYKDATCHLSKGTAGGWVILDILGGILPVVVDAATNNWSQTKGTGCTQQLVPTDSSSVAK